MKQNIFYKDSQNKGFSLIELMVILAIMVVLLAMLAPSLLRYVENSRMQKDESAMDEVCHGVLLALSDSEIFDEAVSYAIPNNYVTYTDSSGIYGAQYVDEEFWAPDGSDHAVTITFNPDENGTYTLANGLVNDMTYGNGSVADSRTAEGVKQCYFSEMGQQKLYHKVEQTIGSTFSEKSATYKNSSYTVFITFDVVDGIKRADVYGEWNGTNLSPDCPASLGSGTSSYTEDEEPEQTKSGGTTQSNFTSSDLQGSGGTSGDIPSYKQDDLPCGHKPATPGNHDKLPCDHYACRCDCPPAPCGVEGHTMGDGLNHDKLECGHFACLCSGCIIPDGGKYVVSNGPTYLPGDFFPVPAPNDTYTYGDYTYTYKTSYGGGWRVQAKNRSKSEYGPILKKIAGAPIVDMTDTFRLCMSFSVAPEIPDTVKTMDSTFYCCYGLKTPPKIPASVQYMSTTFATCKGLEVAPDLSDATGLLSMGQTFVGCTKLKTVGFIPDNVQSMSRTFANCTALETINNFPANLTNIDSIFEECTNLTRVPALPANIEDMDNAFKGCIKLSATPDTTACTKITTMNSAFQNCDSLVVAPHIPDGVTSMTSTFAACDNLQTVHRIPSSVNTFSRIFYNCPSLTGTIIFDAEAPAHSYKMEKCFEQVNWEAQNLNLTGTSSILDICGNTGLVYCDASNGKCHCDASKFLTFSVDGVEYISHRGYTFAKWIGSKDNVDGFFVASTSDNFARIVIPDGTRYVSISNYFNSISATNYTTLRMY